MNDYPTTRTEAAAATEAVADADADLAEVRRGLRAAAAEMERMTDEIVLAGKLDGKNEQTRAAQLRALLAAEPGYLRLVEQRQELEAAAAAAERDRQRWESTLRILLRDMDYVTLLRSQERQIPGVYGATWKDEARRLGIGPNAIGTAQKDPYEDGEGR